MEAPIVILASSRKLGGVCLAGKRLSGSIATWVRPVSHLPCRTLMPHWLGTVAGGVPQLGACLEIPLVQPLPENHQQENWQVGGGRWHTLGAISPTRLLRLTDHEQALWHDGWSSFNGWNDRIPETTTMRDCNTSLQFIRPDDLRFRLDADGGKLGVRAEFSWGGSDYLLKVTDERARQRWLGRLGDGHDGRAQAHVCVSLGLPFKGYCYKLVAGVIEDNREG